MYFFNSTPEKTLEWTGRLPKSKFDFTTASSSPSAAAAPSAPSRERELPTAGNENSGNAASSSAQMDRRQRKAAAEPPATPSTWLAELRSTAMKPLDSEGSTQFHREFYFHPRTKNYPLGKTQAPCKRGPEAAEGRLSASRIGQRPRVYGSLQSDYGKANKDVDDYLQLRKLQGSQSEPLIFMTELNKRKLNPSMVSSGVVSSLIGGSHISLKHTLPTSMHREETRQVGLYEDSYKFWEKNYRPPTHGLAQSECSQFANHLVAQKALLRESKISK